MWFIVVYQITIFVTIFVLFKIVIWRGILNLWCIHTAPHCNTLQYIDVHLHLNPTHEMFIGFQKNVPLRQPGLCCYSFETTIMLIEEPHSFWKKTWFTFSELNPSLYCLPVRRKEFHPEILFSKFYHDCSKSFISTWRIFFFLSA